MKRAPLCIAVAMVMILVATSAYAHDTWLLANAHIVRIGDPVTVSLTSGEAFPNDDFAIDLMRVKRAVVRARGQTKLLTHPMPGKVALRYTWTPTEPSVASFGVELLPKTLTLAPDKIEEYLGEIDASPAIRSEWKSLGGKRAWVESYAKHATAWVRAGDTRDSSWRTPLGLGLEIVPERDPTMLRAGDTLVVRVLRGGAPKPDFAVGAIREGTTKARFSRTDAAGRARVVLGGAGRWLLNGTDLRRSTRPTYTWESDFVTATVYVSAR